MRIDNPSVSGSITFIGGNNTISADAVSLTGSLSGSFAGEFSGEAQTAISGAASIDTSSLATTGSNTFIGNQTHSGSILPAVNDTYDLGSTNYQWRDLFLSSGSLYIDGTQIISSDANTLTFTTDAGQSIKILETGGDDITFQTDTGNIEMKGTVEVQSGKKIIDSAGTVIQFGDTLGVTGSIEVSGTVDGIDLQIMSSSLSASIAGVSTDFDDLTNKPTLLSGSAQIATDVSGSFTSTSSSLASELLKNTTDTLTGDLTVTGTLTAQEFHTEFVSASILFDSGSTKFGDTQDDVHNFTGSLKTTGSVDVTSAVTSNTNFNLYSDGIGVIGKIGNTANDLNIFSTTGGHNGLRMHANGILPTDNSGTIIDNDADLGDPSYRFKDLYLGGSITSGAGATFAGMIMVNGDGIDIDNNDNLRLRFDNASVFKAGLQVATSTGDMITSSATDDFAIRSQSNMLFATGGSTEKMRITSGGYVGIGNTSGAGARTKLGVTFGVGGNAANLAESVSYAAIEMYPYRNSSTYGMFAGAMGTTSGYIQSANTNGTAAGAFSINPWGGGVGIGTNLPLTALHVNQSSDAQILVQGTNKMALHQDSAWNSNILLGCYYDGSNIVYGSTNRGAFKIVGLHDSTTQPQTLSIYGANGASPAGSTVTFNSVGFSQDEDGKVGIGTSEPASKFEVYGGSTGVNDVDRYVRFKASNGEKRFDFHIGGTGNASRLDMYQADGATYGARISSTGDSYVLNDFGIGTTSPARKLDVAGITKTSGLQIKRNYIEQQVDCAFTNGVANQNIDIRLGNISFWGYIEVEITGTYSNQSTPGKLTKIYAVGVNPNGTIYANNPRVADALGPIKNNIALGDFSWDSTNSTYRIRVSHIVSTGNGYTVKVKVFTHGSNGSNGASGILSNLTLSTVYTATSLSRNHVYYDDHVGINELNPAHKLDVKHGRIALTGLTQVTRNTSDPGYVALSGILPGYTANTYPTVESSTNDLHFAVGGVYTGYISHNTGFVDISDISLKENIEDIPDALAKVTAMRGRYFTWKNGLQNNEKQVGFIAQEVEEQLPEAVTAAAGGTKGVSYGKVTALLVNAIKEQQEIIESLKARIETLENN